MSKTLGEFEQLVLFALVSLEDDAYGASIRREIERRTGRDVSAGAVYTVLERLESHGLVASWIGAPTAERGGRRRKHYRLEREGARLLREAHDQMQRMADGLTGRLVRLAGGARGLIGPAHGAPEALPARRCHAFSCVFWYGDRTRSSCSGDIEEDHGRIAERKGRRAAAGWYRRQVVGTLWAWTWRGVATPLRSNGKANHTGGAGMETTFRDVRYAFRGLAKKPGFSALVVATLALGIGANTAIFSVVQAVILRAIPYPDAERLVDVAETWAATAAPASRPRPRPTATGRRGPRPSTGWPSRRPTRRSSPRTATRRCRLRANFVTSDYLDLLGARFLLGRGILPEEDGAPGEHAVAVLSRGAWERVFGADPDAVGRTAMLSGTLYTVVGVLDASFEDLNAGAVPTDVFVPAGMIVQINGAQSWERRAARSFQIVARLAEGRTIEQARSEIEAVMQGLQREDPGTLGDSGVMLTPLRDQLLGTLDAPLLALLTGAVFLLLVGCINVASLMLVRGAARAREMAVRLALGAARGRLVRQLTTEALILAFVGGCSRHRARVRDARLPPRPERREPPPAGCMSGLDPAVLGASAPPRGGDRPGVRPPAGAAQHARRTCVRRSPGATPAPGAARAGRGGTPSWWWRWRRP